MTAITDNAPAETAAAPALTDAAIASQVEKIWHLCKIDRSLLRALSRREDAPGLRHFGLWLGLLGLAGAAVFLSWGSLWALPACFVYGTLYCSSDARWHECAHGTPFRSRRINEVFYHLCSFMSMREAYLWRWSHARHHTHTGFPGLDPEMQVQRPPNLAAILLDFLHLVEGPREMIKISRHALGRIDPAVRAFVPEGERGKMILSSRFYVAIFAGVAAACVASGSLLPAMLIVLPRFYGAWLHQLCSLTQHAGLAEGVLDHRLNARSLYLNRVFAFLYVNMNYHIEHHMFPMTPFHALPKLHAALLPQLPRTYRGLSDAFREIVPALLRQRREPGYFVRRELPVAAA